MKSLRRWALDASLTTRGVGFSLCVFALSRLLTLLVILAGSQIFPGKTVRQAFLAWDSDWYFKTVVNGYSHDAAREAQNTIAFFPGYPMLARWVHYATGLSPLLSLVLLSLIFGAVATCLIWVLAERFVGAQSANRAVALFCFFPGSLAMLTPMSDGMMLTFVLVSFWALFQRRWLVAGIAGAIATVTRPNAIMIVACCFMVAVEAIARNREWKSVLAPLLAFLGVVGYSLFLWHHTGDALAWWHVERAGWYGTAKSLNSPVVVNFSFDKVAEAIALSTALLGLYSFSKFELPATFLIFAIGICLLAFEVDGTSSKLRYVWTAFPIFIAVGAWARTELRYTALLASSAFLLAMNALLALFALKLIP